jgi:hypothetical protein
MSLRRREKINGKKGHVAEDLHCCDDAAVACDNPDPALSFRSAVNVNRCGNILCLLRPGIFDMSYLSILKRLIDSYIQYKLPMFLSATRISWVYPLFMLGPILPSSGRVIRPQSCRFILTGRSQALAALVYKSSR